MTDVRDLVGGELYFSTIRPARGVTIRFRLIFFLLLSLMVTSTRSGIRSVSTGFDPIYEWEYQSHSSMASRTAKPTPKYIYCPRLYNRPVLVFFNHTSFKVYTSETSRVTLKAPIHGQS